MPDYQWMPPEFYGNYAVPTPDYVDYSGGGDYSASPSDGSGGSPKWKLGYYTDDQANALARTNTHEEQQALLKQQMQYADSLRNNESKGLGYGAVYVAQPWTTLANNLKNGIGNAMHQQTQGQMQGQLGQQTGDAAMLAKLYPFFMAAGA